MSSLQFDIKSILLVGLPDAVNPAATVIITDLND